MEQYIVKSLKQHTIIPHLTGYYIMEYLIADDSLCVEGIATVYYRKEMLIICTEDSNNFQYFSPFGLEPFVRYTQRHHSLCKTYFANISIRSTVLFQNEIEAIKEFVLNGIAESNECNINIGKNYIILKSGKYEIPLTVTSCYHAPFKSLILQKIRYVSAIKDFHNITPTEEEFRVDLQNEGTFKFTCPVCTNKNSPAGYLSMPKSFYNKNKSEIKKVLIEKTPYKFLISDPNYILPQIYWFSSILDVLPNLILTEKVLNKLDKFNFNASHAYKDYYIMFKQMYPNVEPVSIFDIKNNEQIYKLHDDVLDVFIANKNKLVNETYLKIKKHFPKYEFSDENFTIFYPRKVDDIVQEGVNLHHCVGSYIQRININKNIILFLRKNGELDKSLITIDIIPIGNKFELNQARGKYNCYISEIPGAVDFVNKWIKKFDIKINNLNKVW